MMFYRNDDDETTAERALREHKEEMQDSRDSLIHPMKEYPFGASLERPFGQDNIRVHAFLYGIKLCHMPAGTAAHFSTWLNELPPVEQHSIFAAGYVTARAHLRFRDAITKPLVGPEMTKTRRVFRTITITE